MTYSAPKGGTRGQRISPRQIKIIHTLKGALGMDRESYEALLQQVSRDARLTSSKGLSWRQAEDVIDELQRKKGNTPAPPRALPFADLDGRTGMASGPQCRMLAGMWREVSRAENDEARGKALDRFIKRIVGVESIRFVKSWQVEKLVKAIETMKASKEVGDEKTAENAGH
jgi:hypothetical protein